MSTANRTRQNIGHYAVGTASVMALALFAGAAQAQSAVTADAPLVLAQADTTKAIAPTSLNDGGIEEVVVSARLRKENQQDVPVSLHALSGADLARDNTDSLQLLQQKLPSISIITSNPRQSSVAIRGIGLTSSNDGQDASTGIFIDGVYQARPGQASFDYEDIGQISVLRGPQGTLFGRNTTSGALVIESRAPTFDFDIGAEADAGNFGLVQAKGFVNGLLSDDFAFRISAASTRQDGFQRDITTGGTFGQRNNVSIRVQGLYQPDEDFRYRLIYSYDRQDFAGVASAITGVVPAKAGTLDIYQRLSLAAPGYTPPSNPYSHVSDWNGYYNNIGYKHSLTGSGDLNFGDGYTFTSISNFTFWRYNPYNDSDNTSLDGIAQFGSPNTNVQYSQEFRVTSPSDQALEWVAGAIYFHSRVGWNLGQLNGSQYGVFSPQLNAANLALLTPASRNYGTLLTSLNGAVAGYTTNQLAAPTTDSGALFGQGTYKVDDRLSFTVGLRASYDYRWEHLTQGNSIANAGTYWGGLSTPINGLAIAPTLANIPVGGYTPAQYLAQFGGDFTSAAAATQLLAASRGIPSSTAYASSSLWNGSGTASISYKVDDGILAYASYSRGYKSAGLSTSIVAAGLPQKVKPEYINDYEVGVKTTLFDNRLLFNVDLFWENYKNYQANINGTNALTGASTSILGGISKIVSRGFETDVTWLPIDDLRIDASASYDEAYFGNFANAPCPVESLVAGLSVCNLTGKSVPYAPKWLANATAEYDYPLSGSNQLYAVGNFSWRSGAYLASDYANSVYSWGGGYGLTNLRVGVRVGSRWDVSVFSNNLFDTNYATAKSGSTTLYYQSVTPGIPRTFGVTARFQL